MKLLTPSEIKEAKEREITRDVLRYKEVKTELQKTETALGKAGADFSALLASQQKKWAAEEAVHREDIQMRLRELDELETSKKRALVPIDGMRELAENELKEAHETLERIKEKEHEVDRLHELFETRLDELEEQRLQLDVRESRVSAIERNSDTRTKQAEEISKKIIEDLEQHNAFKHNELARLGQRERDVQILEIQIVEKFERTKAREAALTDFETKLNDRAATLERGFEELKRKQNG